MLLQNEHLVAGESFLSLLYSYRSLSRAIPQASVEHGTLCPRPRRRARSQPPGPARSRLCTLPSPVCSSVLTQVQQTDQWNRAEIYERTYDVLKPEVTKMKQLMAFCDKSVGICRHVLTEMLSEHRKVAKAYPSEEFLITFARILNMFMVIDALKNMKTSLNNDFAMYKRYVTLGTRGRRLASGGVLTRARSWLLLSPTAR